MAKNYTNTNNSNKNTNKNTVQGNKNCGKIRDAYDESDRY